MQEEQKAKNDTPKIVALGISVVLVLAFLVWRFMGLMNPGPPPPAQGTVANGAQAQPSQPGQPAQATQPGQPGQPGQATTQLASASNAGPGEIREANPLDAEGEGYIPPSSRSFGNMKPPETRQVDSGTGGTGGTGGVRHGHTSTAGNWQNTNVGVIQPPTQVIPPVDVGHQEIVRVEGVVMGPDGFAEITTGAQTVFRRPGQNFDGYAIMRLSDNGVMVRSHGALSIWPIGENVTIIAPGPAPGAQPAPYSPAPRPANVGALPGIQVPPHEVPRGARDYTSGKTSNFMPTERY
jgi:hypothetical protein